MGEWIVFLMALLFICSIIGKPKKKKRKSKKSKSTVKKTAKQIGDDGEKIITNFLSNKPGLVLNDFLFKVGDSYCQIDHILITDYAILVIETKNHSGRIYGDIDNKNWTVAYGSNKYSMYNPVMQNSGHINKLKKLTGDHLNLVGAVVFVSEKCSFNNHINGVYTLEEFKRGFDKLITKKGRKLDKRETYNMLKGLDLSSSKYHREKQIEYANKMKK